MCLNEVETSLPVNLPGYGTNKSKAVGSADRGGMAVCLSHFVTDLDTRIGGQVWMQFSNVQGVLFGFCYIPTL